MSNTAGTQMPRGDGTNLRGGRLLSLGLRCYHQTRAHHDHDNTEGIRNPITMLGSHSEMDVTCTDAVMFRVWQGNKKGENPQNQYHQTYAEQGFHEKPPN
jgi:hypothetical protein